MSDKLSPIPEVLFLPLCEYMLIKNLNQGFTESIEFDLRCSQNQESNDSALVDYHDQFSFLDLPLLMREMK